MISMSDQLFKAGEEEEELTVYSRELRTLITGYLDQSVIFFSFWATGTEQISVERQREAACARCCFVFSYKMNVCISGHWFILVKSLLTTDKQMVSLGKGWGVGGVAAPSRPARAQGFPSPSLCSLIGSALWDSRKDSHTARHCNRRQSLIVSTAADLAASLQSSAHQYALD